MQDRIATAHELVDRLALGEVASHDLLALSGGRKRGDIRKAQNIGAALQPLAGIAAEAARGPGYQ